MTDPNPLERRYRQLFVAYPHDHRDAREDEMIGTLLEVAAPDQRWPEARETWSIVANGLATRAHAADEPWAGVRLAGLVSLAMATMLGVALGGVAALPAGAPPAGRVGIGRSPLPLWGMVLLAIGVAALGSRHRWRSVVPIGVAAAVTVVGGDVMGPRRGLIVPLALFLVLAPMSGRASGRARALAAATGGAAGLWWLYRFIDAFGHAQWGRRTGPFWFWVDRWMLTVQLVPLTRSLWIGLLLAGLVAGVMRVRFGVATVLLALPFGLLTVGSRADGGGGPEVLGAVLLTPNAVVLVGAFRTWIRPHPTRVR